MSKVIPDIDIEALNVDQATKELLGQLMNHLELLWTENQKLRVENQNLKDEIARLKGHKGKPDIKPNRPPESKDKQKNRPSAQANSGKEKEPRPKRILIDRDETIKCDHTHLPTDLKTDQEETEQYQALEKTIKELDTEVRELLAKAKVIDDAVYNLKATNPNAPDRTDKRTPEELMTIIEESQKEILAGLEALRMI